MKFLELAAKLKNKIENVYFFSGDDAYLKQTAYRLIKKATIGNELSDFNETFFDNENWNVEKFVEAVNCLPFASEYKLVHIKNLEKISEKEKQQIQNCIDNIPQTTCLVIELNSNIKLSGGEIIDCNNLDHATLAKYINNEILKNNKKIDAAAINLIIDFCSMNMTKIVSELPKLIAYCGEETITSDMVKSLITPDEEFQVFELTEALGTKNKDKSIKLLQYLIEKKESALLSLITNHFRRVAFCSLSDYSNEELAEMFDVKPFAILKARNQCKYFSKVQLKNILSLLEEVDYLIKSGGMQAENALYYLTFKILSC